MAPLSLANERAYFNANNRYIIAATVDVPSVLGSCGISRRQNKWKHLCFAIPLEREFSKTLNARNNRNYFFGRRGKIPVSEKL